MILGHLGVAAAASRGRETALPALLAAAIAPDMLDVVLAGAGVCNPGGLYSHTLPAAVLVAAGVAGAAYLTRRSLVLALLLAAVVLLHLPADFVTGQKLFWPGGEFVGLRWYRRPLLDFGIESALLAGGWALLRAGRSGRAPRWATSPASLGFLVVVQGALSIYSADQARRLKPSACAEAAAVGGSVGRGDTRPPAV